MSTPEQESQMHEKEWREMRQKTMGELLRLRFTTGNDYIKFLIDMEFERRKFVRDVLIDRWIAGSALIVSVLAVIVSIVAIAISH